MADATAASPSMMNVAVAPSERIAPRRLFAFLIMVFGMFMSILDIQVVVASLTDIQAGLSASSTEVSWVQTAYLIAEVVAIPAVGLPVARARHPAVVRDLGRRLHGFQFLVRICLLDRADDPVARDPGISGRRHDPDRVRIGLHGVSAFEIPYRRSDHRPGRDLGADHPVRPSASYITDALSWHWLFFINVVPGIGIIIGVWALVDFDQPNFKLLDHFDWFGLIAMGGFLGALEYVLEEGPQYEWLQDTSVAVCASICVVSAIAFFYRVLTAREPIVDIRAFSNRNFGVGCLISFCVGIGLYGLTYVYPRYLSEVRGYSALMIGETVFVSGATMFLMAPIVGRVMLKVDLRYIIAFGLVVFALGSYQMTWMTRDYDFYELLLPQILRGIGMMCAMVPTNNIALGTLGPDQVKNASGLFNLTRNLGGAVGLAVINEVLNDRTDLHISRLQDRVNWGNATATETLNMLTQRMQGLGDASLMALKQLSQIVHRQAVVMGYSDVFFMLTLFYVSLSLLVMLLKKPDRLGAAPGGH